MDKSVGIVLAGGSGKRMGMDIPKQYISIHGKPLLYYSLLAFQNSNIDEIILVCASSDIEYCKNEIVHKYNLSKVVSIVAGGTERCLSVYQGLLAVKDKEYVLIHDGARPLIKKERINNIINEVKKNKACIAAVPVKDTVRIVDDNMKVIQTPKRDNVYNIQTPQAFSYELIYEAYSKLIYNFEENDRLVKENTNSVNNNIENSLLYICNPVVTPKDVTDDAMVLDLLLKHPIQIVEGDYTNIKVTTYEDIQLVKSYLQ